jgi:hypothetical protein
LLRLLEDWREALDKNYYIASVLMDLSKAFDCLPHAILLDKLSAYGVSSKKSDNCVSNTFSKILEKTGRTLTGL